MEKSGPKIAKNRNFFEHDGSKSSCLLGLLFVLTVAIEPDFRVAVMWQ